MRFDFVIFDLDGTIYDSLPVAMSALLRVLREDGNDTVGMSDLQAWAGVPGHVTLSELGYKTRFHEWPLKQSTESSSTPRRLSRTAVMLLMV